MAKNFPEWFLTNSDTTSQLMEFLGKLLFKYPVHTVDHRKRVISTLKILEEWVKNYKSQSLSQPLEDDDEDTNLMASTQSVTPYTDAGFRGLIYQIVDTFIVKAGGSAQSDIVIAILSILNNLDAS